MSLQYRNRRFTDHFYRYSVPFFSLINLFSVTDLLSTAVIPTEEHTHKNEPATLYCTIKGAGKQLKVKWTDHQVNLYEKNQSNI